MSAGDFEVNTDGGSSEYDYDYDRDSDNTAILPCTRIRCCHTLDITPSTLYQARQDAKITLSSRRPQDLPWLRLRLDIALEAEGRRFVNDTIRQGNIRLRYS